MLRTEIKEAIILVLFGVFLHETLFITTEILILLGLVLIWFNIRPSKKIRTVLTLGMFVSYVIGYGKVIDPEVGLNFLTAIIVLKLLEKETERDRYMIFFGLFLLISAGSLFQRSLLYVGFFALSFFVLIQDFYRGLGLSWKVKDVLKAGLWVAPLAAIFFFLFPRLPSPFPPARSAPSPGEVGYTTDVQISDVESLVPNPKQVFEVKLDRRVRKEDLYWRGNTLSFTDGWNWTLMPQEKIILMPEGAHEVVEGIKQNIRLYHQEDFYFTLDHPLLLKSGDNFYEFNDLHVGAQERWRTRQLYQVTSLLAGEYASIGGGERYLRHSLKKADVDWILANFHADNVRDLLAEVRGYFSPFSYSLSPGRVRSFREFMTEKKIGFCSHYSSALALILRAKGHPTRLVSGFMGGELNPYADFYIVSQNDAHVWVEVFDEGKWIRVDPTAWLVPERISLGGEAYVAQANEKSFFAFGVIRDAQKWFAQWDFLFYQWLEEMDYEGQTAWLTKMKFEKKWLYGVIPLILVLFVGFYAWMLARAKRIKDPLRELWVLFGEKMRKKGLELDFTATVAVTERLESWESVERDQALEVWRDLVRVSFEKEGEGISELRKRMRRL